MKTSFNVIICGSREFENYELLKEKCNHLLSRKLKDPDTKVVIVSGCAKGADSLGEKYASETGLEILKYPADWDRFGKRAGYLRNKQMAEVGNAVIAFMVPGEDKNRGTKNMISLAKAGNLLVREIIDEE